MSDNVISFEEYLKKKKGKDYNPDLSDIFKKDLREQTDLLDWYIFHNSINKHKLFVHTLLYENHNFENINPNVGFVVSINAENVKKNANGIIDAVKWEGREYIHISAAEKTYRELGEMITGFRCNSNHDTFNAFKEKLLNSNKVFIIQEFSKVKTNQNKAHLVRALIKVIDDAHFDDIKPKVDLIFIDYPDFLQKSWEDIGIYLNLMI